VVNAECFHNIDDDLDRLISDGTESENQLQQKMDKVYCLPFFAKPGKHTYIVQYQSGSNFEAFCN
jgi:hypothetical protein